jgi:hypothetical protein
MIQPIGWFIDFHPEYISEPVDPMMAIVELFLDLDR